MHGHQPHPATPVSDAAFLIKRGKKRGNYSCGRCGLPKKGHKCPFNQSDDGISTPVSAADGAGGAGDSAIATLNSAYEAASGNLADASPQSVVFPVPVARCRRALSFDDVGVDEEELEDEWIHSELGLETGKLPAFCLWEVLRRLPPAGLLSAARVCRGWRETTRRLWRAAEELRLRVPAKAQIGFVGSVLQKCPGLVKLSLRMERDFDATMLACIAFSCPNLQSLEIFTSDSAVNWISGFFDCPKLKEISLDFSQQENDSTDITTVVDALGRSSPKLQNIHIASVLLSHAAVLALTAANLRELRMLSLVLGSEITDASVAAIASSFPKLELLDLSGSSISDSGIGMICNVFPETLSKLLLALCPNITSSGIQFAAAQLPHLELMDCGMTVCDSNPEKSVDEEESDNELQKTPNSKLHHIYQKLIIKHSRLKKLSLWGCSGLDALYLNCPRLNDLNLNSCRNLHPERLLLQCRDLESVHASDCQDMLINTLETQVYHDPLALETHFPSRRLPDGSKRIGVPYPYNPEPSDDDKKWRRAAKRRCAVIVTS
ncbi:UNVERIFIED_CONTAM: F-box/LRR-repeat protein 17 [Sesamum latifolium]|uniref:F-box/LRR-repeat protein 17 n=1 Tax=Sesamum latifolium TaxID=2727402 RepID=A0AAW2XWA3_9LAMI